MKNILFSFFCVAFFWGVQAQSLSDTVKMLYYQKKYDEALGKIKFEKQLNASGLFYAGLCYFAKQQDQRALYCFNRATEKDPTNAEYYYYQGTSLMYLKRFEEAIRSFSNATKYKVDDAQYFVSFGDAYYNTNKLDSAIIQYQKATLLEKCPPRAYLMNGQAFTNLKKPMEALKAYYEGKEKIDKNTAFYTHCLYNIALLEYEKQEYLKAVENLLELLQLTPQNFEAVTKLIQSYTALQEYAKAEPYRQQLYEAYQAKTLPDDMKEMFCMDKFVWKNQIVTVFEKFEEIKDKTYYKHLFLLLNERGEVKKTLLTESSFAVQAEGKKYVLGSVENGIHHTYWQFLFEEKFDYTKMKEAIIQILDGKAKPSTSSSISQGKN